MLRVIGTGPKEEAWGTGRTFLITFAVSLFFTLTVTPFCNAQDHSHEAVALIDGSEHPELIPDTVAYRLYFTTVSLSPHPTVEQLQLQLTQLGAGSLGNRAGPMQLGPRVS